MSLPFTKMHGAGNDYVYVDAFNQSLPDDLPALAIRLANRNFGIGGDGLIAVLPPTVSDAHVKMRMFNNDGSEAEMCGNGVRCVAKYAYDRGLARHNPLRVETGRGVLPIELELASDGTVSAATVDMGEPILDFDQIGVIQKGTARNAGWTRLGEHEIRLSVPHHDAIPMTLVSMGNPHATIYVDDVSRIALESVGPAIERHPSFPRKINVHFVQVHSPNEVTVRHWERGTGVTLACGTGACAVCVSGVLTGRTGRELLAHLPGGDLRLRWDEATNHVFMTGPAVEVFRGEWNGL